MKVTSIVDEADIFSEKPKLKVFLSPNNPVDEWPALVASHSKGSKMKPQVENYGSGNRVANLLIGLSPDNLVDVGPSLIANESSDDTWI